MHQFITTIIEGPLLKLHHYAVVMDNISLFKYCLFFCYSQLLSYFIHTTVYIMMAKVSGAAIRLHKIANLLLSFQAICSFEDKSL